VAAECLRQENKIGSITPGKMADIIAVRGDPLKDITLLQKIQVKLLSMIVVHSNCSL
jgi:imidazolonepropionase-like amidohydrolase